MKHNIKLPDGTIRTIDCRLGSGIFDKNGREFFEDDKVKHDGEIYTAEYTYGHFGITDDDGDWFDIDLCTKDEIIGHVDD